jgi:hypothetical protein
MRALWSVVVVCLVAVGGVGCAEAHSAVRATSLARLAPAAPGAALRAQLHAARGRGHAVEHRLPPVALSGAFSLPPPPLRAVAQPRLACGRAAAFPVLTGSARGPPID